MIDDTFKFYYKATQLKDMLRQGAVQWKVEKERLESIAEHTFGCLILAIALESELKTGVDLAKVLEMLTIHELEEIIIGDVTPLDNVDKKDLQVKARFEIAKMLEGLNYKERLINLTDEYNEGKTKEAKFSKAVDKLECVLEFKKYQDMGLTSLEKMTPEMYKQVRLKEYVDSGKYDLADIFFIFHKPAYEELGITEDYWFKTLKCLDVSMLNNFKL